MSSPQIPTPQAAPTWQTAPGAPAYTSPIPIVRTHLGHAIASEWTKLRSVRSTLWTLGVFVLLVVGIGVMTGALVAANASPESLKEASALPYGLFGVLLGSVCVITLGVLTTASEYGTGMIRTTTVACPTRARVLTAKAVVLFTVVFAVTLVSTAFVSFALTGILSDAAEPSGGEWLKATVGISLYMALLGLFSMLIGSIIRHSAGAITIMIGLVLAPLVIALFMVTESLQKVREFLFDYSIPTQLGVFYTASIGESGPSGWDPLWIALGATAAAFAGAWALLEKRDV
ncbi:ABC transporter permease subunit [Streptomyces sp. NPDC049915]|uniref:ABC transporter permease subunit n=1 Tax=Streptomyces sp. NPDC049915 TaxID=3155510 RepID=UPI00343443AC